MLAHLARRHARPRCRIATPPPLSRHVLYAARAYSADPKCAPLQNFELTFLGTGSSQPSFSRKQSSTAIRIAGETWLLDCGEATQMQMMHAGLSIDDVTRIYITHLHGDHVNGMAGLLSGKSNSSKERTRSGKASSRLQIYGPSGIRSFLRAALGNTYSNFSHLELQVRTLVTAHARPCARFTPLSTYSALQLKGGHDHYDAAPHGHQSQEVLHQASVSPARGPSPARRTTSVAVRPRR